MEKEMKGNCKCLIDEEAAFDAEVLLRILLSLVI